MNDDVLNQLVNAVNVILNPNSSQNERSTAHSICESCKENELSGLIGFTIASNKAMEPHIKQFGLQLMQHYIKSKWTQTAEEGKMQMKNNAVSLLKDCHFDEHCYVKDGIAHVVTEIAKHVWPQQWQTMVQDLITLAKQGPVQTELVELIFLRLAEDAAVLQNIAVAHRVKDIRQGLSLSMGEIILFFYSILEKTGTVYSQLVGTTNSGELQEVKIHHNLACCTLKALQGFVEWANLEYVFLENGMLIKLLCHLLHLDGLKILAADVLLLIAGRKGKPDGTQIFQMTQPEYTNEMVKAIQKSVSRASTDEEQYVFLKRMGNVFASLTNQITAVWPDKDTPLQSTVITDLSSHSIFLDILLAFQEHENPVVVHTVTGAWANLLKHSDICKDATLKTYLARLFEIGATGIRKDAKKLLPVYTQLDFNDDDEVEYFMGAYRTSLLELLRWCTKCQPIHCMTVVLQWLKAELSSPVDFGLSENGEKLEKCAKSSPTVVRWQALSTTLDLVLHNIKTLLREGLDKSTLLIDDAQAILSSLLNSDVLDIVLCQCQLEFVTGFLYILELMPNRKELTVNILTLTIKLINLVQEHPDRWAQSSKNLRRHALNAIVHMCKHYPNLVIEVNDSFKTMMMGLVSPQNPLLNPLEKVCIFESLVLVSGEWNHYNDQSSLIGEIMNISHDMWPSKDSNCLKCPFEFARMISLCSPSSEYGSTEQSEFRSNVSFCILLTMGMMNRARVPSDVGVAQSGGFMDASRSIRNPAAPHLLPVLEHIAIFINMFHSMWTDAVRDRAHPEMVDGLNMRKSEIVHLVSTNPNFSNKTEEITERIPWVQLQNFLILNVENCYQIMGGIGNSATEIYSSVQLFPSVLSKVFSHLQIIPELRMKSFIRQFLFYFLKYCPLGNCNSVTAPLLLKYCQFMNALLMSSWNQYGAREQARLKIIESSRTQYQEDPSEAKEEDEILKEQMLRLVSREYLEMLVNLCVIKKPKKNDVEIENQTPEAENQDVAMPSSSAPNVSQLTELGLSLADGEVGELLLNTGLSCISWHDTPTAYKGIQLLWAILKKTFTNPPSYNDDGAKIIFESLLRGLQRHGQHEGGQAQFLALSLFTYVNLRPTHPSLVSILKSLPHVQSKSVDEFDANYFKYSEKKRKINFKKLVSVIIEKHVGQRLRVFQKMQKLPQILQNKTKVKKSQNIDASSLGLELFFQE